MPQARGFVESLEPYTCRADLCLPANRGAADGSLCVPPVLFSNPDSGKIFRASPDRPWGPPSLLYIGNRFLSGGGGGEKQEGRAHAPQSQPSAEVKERVELYIYSPSGLSWPVLWQTLPVLVILQAFRYRPLVNKNDTKPTDHTGARLSSALHKLLSYLEQMICALNLSFYPLKPRGAYSYQLPNVKNSAFCPHCAFMCFIGLTQSTAIIPSALPDCGMLSVR
jgi:hypothetical protein